jgi:hypothetical protein
MRRRITADGPQCQLDPTQRADGNMKGERPNR